jgi:membrane protease YdiL (CAAX protease family)
MQIRENSKVEENFMLASWQRLPIVVRAVVIGVLVSLLALPWPILAAINFRLLPAIPWSVVVMAIYLWLCWQYLGGKGWPRSTADSRRRNLRARRISPPAWRWCFLAFGLGWAGLKAFEFIFDRIFKVPQEPFPNVAALPFVTVLVYILMVAIVAGFYEEAAFRGYMQGPIERRHGPWVAYLVVGILFWLAHITGYVGHWGLFFASAWYFLAAAMLLGALAYLTDSILPGIVLHTLGDAISGLAWWWQSSQAAPAGSQRGWLFPLAVIGVVLCTPASVLAYRKLGFVARRDKPQSPTGATA